jgi:hypothetical protein
MRKLDTCHMHMKKVKEKSEKKKKKKKLRNIRCLISTAFS